MSRNNKYNHCCLLLYSVSLPFKHLARWETICKFHLNLNTFWLNTRETATKAFLGNESGLL